MPVTKRLAAKSAPRLAAAKAMAGGGHGAETSRRRQQLRRGRQSASTGNPVWRESRVARLEMLRSRASAAVRAASDLLDWRRASTLAGCHLLVTRSHEISQFIAAKCLGARGAEVLVVCRVLCVAVVAAPLEGGTLLNMQMTTCR